MSRAKNDELMIQVTWPRVTLRYKLLLYSVVLMLVPLGLAGTRMISITQDELKSSANQEIITTAEKVARDIDSIYADTWLAPLRLVVSGIDSENLDVSAKLALLQAAIRNIADMASGQISVEGIAQPLRVTRDDIFARLIETEIDADLALEVPADRVAALRRDRKGVFLGDLEYIENADLWLITVVLPLQQPIGGRVATLAARMDLSRLAEFVESHTFQQTGTVLLVDADGRRIFDPLRTDLTDLEIVDDALALLAGGTRAIGVRPYRRPNGEPMLAAYAFPRHLDLAVVVERNEADAYLAVAKMRESLLGWILLGLAVAVIGGLVSAFQISRPIEKIAAVAQRVGEGDFEVRARNLRTRDEIGDLGRQINQMIDGLVERERVKGENALLRELNERLNLLNDQKNKLLGMAAHDLRNPIGVVHGCSEMILEDEAYLDKEMTPLVKKIESTSKFMLRMLNDLLDLSHIDSGKLELNLSKADICALIRQDVELNQIIAGKKNIQIEFSLAEDIPEIVMDAPKIEQVLNNLISNAVKFSFPDTRVRVSARRQEDAILVAVADQGQGIPSDELEKVFQAFTRTSVKSTAGEKSSGLGLAIVQKIVEGSPRKKRIRRRTAR